MNIHLITNPVDTDAIRDSLGESTTVTVATLMQVLKALDELDATRKELEVVRGLLKEVTAKDAP